MEFAFKHAAPGDDASGGPAEAAIDEGQLMENMAGCREILAEAGQVFLEDIESMLASVKAAVSARDLRATERAAHLIKGAFLSLAAPTAARLADAIERGARAGEYATENAMHALIDQVELVRTALVRIMNAS
jgi:HPt (histidine-containing phosphotransfer) domain-containing protein